MERILMLNEKTIHLDKDSLERQSSEALDFILLELQEEVHKVAKEKNRISALPKNKKSPSTWRTAMKLKHRLMDLQDAQAAIGMVKKQKGIALYKELEYYKEFFFVCESCLRKGLFKKLKDKVQEEKNLEL